MPTILFEDSDVLVLSKPAGMIVNNADTSRMEFTLQDFIDKNFPVKDKNGNEDFLKRSGIVHRLDKETSGAIIIARNSKSFENLQLQFKERKIQKTYIALVHGRIVSEGIVNVPIGRLPWNRMRFGVISNGRESYTEFKVLKYYLRKIKKKEEILSHIEVFPKTGRTHQIRVHLQYAGFPIVSDALYAGRKVYREDKEMLQRQFLHAHKIIFTHPVNNNVITVEAPLSEDLNDFLSQLAVLKS